jgi:hypothetical protein
MKHFTPIRLWLLLVLLYTTASLMLIDRHAEGTGASSKGPVFVLPAEPTRQPRAQVIPGSPNQAVFEIPFTPPEMGRTGKYRFFLKSARDLPRCTVQIIAEGDHRSSFSHLYRLSYLPRTGFAFTAPLLDDVFYWRTIRHTGAWTAWERRGVRRLQVKLFTSVPVSEGDLELRFQADPAPAATTTLASSRTSSDTLALGERFEIAFNLAGWHGNPFDYQELPVTAEVTDPNGRRQHLLPFLYQDFTAVNRLAGEQILPNGPKHLLVRHRPVTEGAHTYRLLLRDAGGTNSVPLLDGRFDVTPGTPPGFLRVSLRAPHFFERADGRFVYLLGWNLPYPVDRPYGTDYVPYLPKDNSLTFARKLIDDIADCGGNFMNYWLSDWWNGLEWNEQVDQYGGIARYNLKNAWMNDQIVKHCEARGVYMQWETLNHVRLSRSYGWPRHPYNRRNGGFLRRPDDFWTHPESLRWSENRLSYIVARYADSPSIHSWNVMSEPDQVSTYVWPQAKDFLRSQTAYMANLDPYGHIVSSHVCLPDHDIPFFAEKLLQFVNSNAYPGLGGLGQDQIDTIRDYSVRYNGHGKPVMITETAGHWGGDPPYKMRRDTVGAIWAGIASALAGCPLSWWWNFNYGEDLGRLHYRVAADFMKGEDLIAADVSAGGRWLNRAVEVASRDGNARALGVGNGTRRFLFLYNFDTLCRTRQIPSVCADTRITFREMVPGGYLAEYWDLRKGKTAIIQEVTAGTNGIAVLSPPEFTEGWAVKIIPRGTVPPPQPPPSPAAVTSAAAPDASARPGPADDWAWSLEPLVGIVHPEARRRSLMEARLALPEACRGRYPAVTDTDGKPVPCAWQPLDEGRGWLLKIPSAGFDGPLRVTAATEPPASGPVIDEEAFGLGLTVAPGSRAWIGNRADFVQEFTRHVDRKQTRVGSIDQLENPLGDTSSFLATYAGPLLIPADGLYDFASNSDDASFVRIDGQEIVAWPGQHDMEVLNRPDANDWQHRAQLQLSNGLHWVEYNHQQRGGGCLARLGWRMPDAVRGGGELLARPFGDAGVPEMEVVPAWALDGRIPCRVTVLFQGQGRLVQDPCIGLELRRPATRIATVALGGAGSREFKFYPNEGRQWIDVGGFPVPLWAWNAHVRRFSLEWELCVDSQRRTALKAMLYDIDMPLSVQFGQGRAVEKPLARRQWTAWMPPAPGQAAFVIRAGGVPLVQGVLTDAERRP